MNLQPGMRLGPYEILSPLGAGGMGEVWKAKDSRLDREVAIKILPPGLAENEQFRARFEREAKVISSLNHPNICTLHDVGQLPSSRAGTTASAPLHYLVLELVEGESLAARIKKGPLPLPEVFRFGAQIAEALDAAHQRGIVHRDLKPENVMLTRAGAKLLDFGLARAASEGPGVISGLTSMPTEARQLTTEGTILGTFQYMAPEQLEGLEADARTDIFALGALLYEMATAKKAFAGSSKTSLIAAIVASQPEPISTAVPMTPPALDHVVRKCLEKNPEDRWQSARDVAGQLRWISEAGSQAGVTRAVVSSRRMSRRLLLAAALLGWAVAVLSFGWSWSLRKMEQDRGKVLRAELLPPPRVDVEDLTQGAAILSPDGASLAFMAFTTRGRWNLYVRSLSSGESRLLDGTEGASFPFWSADSRWIAFFANGKLRKIPSGGGPVQILCDAHDGRGGTWGRSGVIVFAPDIKGPLMQVSEGGGTPRPVTKNPEASVTHRNPFFLPDGQRFLFTEREALTDPVGHVSIASLEDGKPVKVIDDASNPQYSDGFLFFVRDGNLVAQRMEESTATVQGSTLPVAQGVDYYNPRDLGNYSLSTTGDLVFRKRRVRKTQLAWVDPEGREPEPIGETGLYGDNVLTARANNAILVRDSGDGTSSDLWVMDLIRKQAIRSTFLNAPGTLSGVLSADGTTMAVSAAAGAGWGKSTTWLQSTSGGGKKETVVNTSSFFLTDWSSDGRWLIGGAQQTGTGFDINMVDLKGSRKVETFVATPYSERSPKISPDGRWLLWQSDESGAPQVYLSDFPDGRQKWQVSSNGGTDPFWGADGTKVFYNGQDGVMAVDLGHGPLPAPGNPTQVLRQGSVRGELASTVFATDGKRFLALIYAESGGLEPFRLIRNWRKTLEE